MGRAPNPILKATGTRNCFGCRISLIIWRFIATLFYGTSAACATGLTVPKTTTCSCATSKNCAPSKSITFPAFSITGERVLAASPVVLRPSYTHTNQHHGSCDTFTTDEQ